MTIFFYTLAGFICVNIIFFWIDNARQGRLLNIVKNSNETIQNYKNKSDLVFGGKLCNAYYYGLDAISSLDFDNYNINVSGHKENNFYNFTKVKNTRDLYYTWYYVIGYQKCFCMKTQGELFKRYCNDLSIDFYCNETKPIYCMVNVKHSTNSDFDNVTFHFF